MSDLPDVPEHASIPKMEEEVLDHWRKHDCFQESMRRSEGKKPYTFYDGPPFATGLPHYGHLLAGTIKDVVTRYAHQTGHHVPRRFGWDCHGLPVEFEIDKKLGIQGAQDVEKMGIRAYNDACRGIVQRYTGEWKKVVERVGRWIDMENNYKTMDASFMESVWWVFSQLHAKGLVYRGHKVMPYSTACTTPLSNFEANQNYQDVDDPAVTVSFPLVDDPETCLLAWTTTPWTLPSNLAVCVHPTLEYVYVKDKESGKTYVLARARLHALYPADKKAKKAWADAAAKVPEGQPKPPPPSDESRYEVVKSVTGKDLVGLKYKPLFDFFASWGTDRNAFRVLEDTYVTSDSGTGIVHQAPAFGEDDYRVCKAADIIRNDGKIVCPVDADGRYTDEVPNWKGVHVKAADTDIIRALKEAGRLVRRETESHTYPFCWRSNTPLIYKVIPAWFINVESFKGDLLKTNDETYWVPENIREKRFANWLKDARDWCVSRNRYWGTPLPIWTNEDFSEIRVIGSVDELRKATGDDTIEDLHRDYIDHLTIPSKDGKGVLKRVPEVFDCWFESGSMPYASNHYPFSMDKDQFAKIFPADFIAEGIDQTRGWFYTLLVLSTALFGKPAWKNLIVNGLLLAADGNKMSKSKKNYPDPMNVVDKHGADALRMYLINSPAVRADNLKFKEEGVHGVNKDVILPWFHAFRFLVQNAKRYSADHNKPFTPNAAAAHSSTNVFDQWVLSAASTLVNNVHAEMGKYFLYAVMPKLVTFIDDLTNWYLRFNRSRAKGSDGPEEALAALSVLHEVLMVVSRVMAPFTPFFADYTYQVLKLSLPEDQREDSVHYLMMPDASDSAVKPEVERAVQRMQTVVELARVTRDRNNRSIKTPLRELVVCHHDQTYLDDLKKLEAYIVQELNVEKLTLTTEQSKWVVKSARPNHKALGLKYGKGAAPIRKAVTEMKADAVEAFQASGSVEILPGITLGKDDIEVDVEYSGALEHFKGNSDQNVLTCLDITLDNELLARKLVREVSSRIQRLRKRAGVIPTDVVEVFYDAHGSDGMKAVFTGAAAETLTTNCRMRPLPMAVLPAARLPLAEDREVIIDDLKLSLVLLNSDWAVHGGAVAEAGFSRDAFFALEKYVATRVSAELTAELNAGPVVVNADNTEVTLVAGKNIFPSVAAAVDAGHTGPPAVAAAPAADDKKKAGKGGKKEKKGGDKKAEAPKKE